MYIYLFLFIYIYMFYQTIVSSSSETVQPCNRIEDREVRVAQDRWAGNFHELDMVEKMKLVLNEEQHIKSTAQYIINAYDLRSKIVNRNSN